MERKNINEGYQPLHIEKKGYQPNGSTATSKPSPPPNCGPSISKGSK